MQIGNAIDLKAAIAELEAKKIIQEKALVEHFNLTYESLKPINMIRNTFHELSQSDSFKTNLLDAGIGLGAGFLSKKLIIGKSTNLFRKLAGMLLEMGIATIVTKNSDKIKDAGKSFIEKLFGGRNSRL